MGSLLTLQNEQLEHDKKCHRDILFMSNPERFKHIALHYGKYSGRLAELLRNSADPSEIQSKIKKTLVDSFIIVLNSAELLQIDLEKSLKEKLGMEKDISINELSDILKESSPDLFSLLNALEGRDRIMNLLLEMISIGGFMQKAAEELDHMMEFPRNAIKNQTINLLSILLLSGIVWAIDYEKEIRNRWEEISQKTVIQGPQ